MKNINMIPGHGVTGRLKKTFEIDLFDRYWAKKNSAGAHRYTFQEALKAHSGVRRYEDGKDGEGGWGVTVAHLEAD